MESPRKQPIQHYIQTTMTETMKAGLFTPKELTSSDIWTQILQEKQHDPVKVSQR